MERIELRSEKVRNMMGEIPPLLTRTGTAIILVMFLALGAASCMIHYPVTTESDGTVDLYVNEFGDSCYSASLMVPYRYAAFYRESRKVDMTFEGREGLMLRDFLEYAEDRKVTAENGEEYCVVTVHINEEDARMYDLRPGMRVHGVSVIDNRNIWQLLFKLSVD